MLKLFASDFDNTLHFWQTDDQYIVSPAGTAAIRAFQEEGGLFGVCTGRPLLGITKQLDAPPGIDFAFDFYIAGTGASLWDRDRNLIWRRTIPRDAVVELYRNFASVAANPHNALVCAGEDYWSIASDHPFPSVRRAETIDELEGPFGGFATSAGTPERATQIAQAINEHFGDVACAYVNTTNVDVVPAGCSKGDGLRRIAAHYGATLTAGMGDSLNDLSLLDAADVAYTFAESVPQMYQHADVLINTAAEAIADFARR